LVGLFKVIPKLGIIRRNLSSILEELSCNWRSMFMGFPFHLVRDRPRKPQRIDATIEKANQGRMIRDRVIVDFATDKKVGELSGHEHVVTTSFTPTSGLRENASLARTDILAVLDAQSLHH
jgi:hypothetical protein